MTTQRDKVIAIDAQLTQSGLPTYTQVLEVLIYLHQQAQLSDLTDKNCAMRSAARIKQEAHEALSHIY